MVWYPTVEDRSNGFKSDLPGRVQQSQLKTMQTMVASMPYENAYEPLSQPEPVFRKREENATETKDYQILDSDLTESEILDRFEEFIEANLPLQDYEESKYRQMEVQQKWKILCEQRVKSPIHKPKYYVDELKRYGGANRKRRSWGRATKEIASLNHVLRKLKSELLFAEGFTEEFISESNKGVNALMNALTDVQRDQVFTNTTKKSKQDLYKQFMQDELDCLLCIKYALKCEEGLVELLQIHGGLATIAECAYSSKTQTCIVALQILTLCCQTPGGFQRIIRITSHFRNKYQEEVRFHTLIQTLTAQASLKFQIVCVRFFNEMWKCTPRTNAKVYLQYELEMAGFDPNSLEKYDKGNDPEYEVLQKELDKWRKQCINVGGAKTELQDMETRNVYLRDEIDRLNEKVKRLESGEDKRRRNENQWKEKCHEYRERAAELQDTVENLKQLFVTETGREPDSNLVKEASKPLDIYGTIKIQRERENRPESTTELSSDVPDAPPFPKDLSATVKRKVSKVPKGALPHLSWTPVFFTEGTIFEDIDDEAKLREIDFHEFEELFKRPTPPKLKEGRDRLERALLKSAEQIVFVEINRAKNMIITKRRIGQSARDIKEAIDKCDVGKLPGELAELLLKYLPTKEELKKMAQHANDYAEMGEAEQFLFQLAQVERLESKLSLLAFMGVFQEITEKVIPDIEAMHRNSLLILWNVKLKKIFEIILAFGNYMNSGKRGYSQGFKLESLAKLNEVKSTNKSITLLHYLEEFVATRYPELYDFYEELDLSMERGVCYQAIFSDVLGLRKGLDLVKYEKEKQSDNTTIHEFHNRSAGQVARIAEAFHKMDDDYQKLCSLFGENYKLVDTDDIFKPLVEFANSFKKAAEDNKKRRPDRDSYLKPVTSPRHYKHSQSPLNASVNDPIVPRLDLSNASSSKNGSSNSQQNGNGLLRFRFDDTSHLDVQAEHFQQKPVENEDIYDDVFTNTQSSRNSEIYDDAVSPKNVVNYKSPTRVYFNEEPSRDFKRAGETNSPKVKTTENVLSSSSVDRSTPLGTPRAKFIHNGYSTDYEEPVQTTVQQSTIDQQKPVIKQSLKENGEPRGKLPRVPIDVTEDDYQSYYNVYSLKRNDSNKPMPEKPHIKTDSFAAQEYEELPYERMHTIPTAPLAQEPPPPPVPPKLDPPSAEIRNGKPRALPSPPHLERGYSVQLNDAIGLLDKVLDDEVQRETLESRL